MYKAIKTFAGLKLAMKKGDTKDYIDEEIAQDLLRAGYIEKIKEEVEPATVEEPKKEEVVEEVKPKRTTTRKKK